MLNNIFITALRSFWKQKGYTFINILGLTLGLACSLLILLWVQDERQIDQFHANSEQIYRVQRNAYYSGEQIFTWPAIPMPLAEALEQQFPEVIHAELHSWENELLVTYGQEGFKEKGYFVGDAFLEVFSFPLVQGNPTTALSDLHAIVISETVAKKYFGDENPMGQTLRIDDRKDFTVTGVFEDIPQTSSLQFDVLLPIEDFIQRNEWTQDWGNNGLRLITLLQPGTDVAALNAKIENIIMENSEGSKSEIFLQPYGDTYLYNNFVDGKQAGGRIEYVRIFTLTAIFILIIASINFMNLATARSSQRAKEVGVRKSVGASRHSLIRQFLTESLLIVLLALGVALLLMVLILPTFNELTGKSLSISLDNMAFWLMAVGAALFTGLLAGSYPAFFLSAFNIVAVLKGTVRTKRSAVLFRQGLVVFQFTMSILLIIGTVVIYRQLHYIQNKNIGLEREDLMYFRIEGDLAKTYPTFRTELLKQPGVAQVTASSQNPLSVGTSTSGGVAWDGKTEEDDILFSIISADYDFLETMGMELAQGRGYDPAFSTDTVNFIINEQAARAMGMDDALNQPITVWDVEGKVIGVVKDFHYSSLHDDIGPLVIRWAPGAAAYVYVRTEAGRMPEVLAATEDLYRQFNPSFPFDYIFMNQYFDRIYRSEQVIGTLANGFAVMAIVISCLGLLGLASYTAERRRKEVGIRKVLGASVTRLVVLLTSDFTWLVLIGFVIAAPLAYWFMDDWLQAYAYRINLHPFLFIGAGLAALVIAWLTVSYQSIRAARVNPTKSLRSE
jgi:predicted permease